MTITSFLISCTIISDSVDISRSIHKSQQSLGQEIPHIKYVGVIAIDVIFEVHRVLCLSNYLFTGQEHF